MAAAEARLKQMDLAARKREECKKNPEPRGRGMTCRADEFFAKQYARGNAPGLLLKLPEFPARTASPPDDFSLGVGCHRLQYRGGVCYR